MPKITYIDSSGNKNTIEIEKGLSVMEGAVQNNIPEIDAEGNEQNILNGSNKLLEKNKIHSIYVEIADTKSNYDNKKYLIEEHLKKNNFILKFSLPIKSFSYLSNLKATDNLFINNSFNLES